PNAKVMRNVGPLVSRCQLLSPTEEDTLVDMLRSGESLPDYVHLQQVPGQAQRGSEVGDLHPLEHAVVLANRQCISWREYECALSGRHEQRSGLTVLRPCFAGISTLRPRVTAVTRPAGGANLVELTGHSALAVGSAGDEGVLVMGEVDSPQNGGLALLSLGDGTDPCWGWPLTAGTPPAQRSGHSATLVRKQYMVVVGGSTQGRGAGLCSDVWVLDLAAGAGGGVPTWWRLPFAPCSTQLPPPRTCHAAGRVAGKVCIFGGETKGGRVLGDTWTLELVQRDDASLAAAEERIAMYATKVEEVYDTKVSAESQAAVSQQPWSGPMMELTKLQGLYHSRFVQEALMTRHEVSTSTCVLNSPVYGVWRRQELEVTPSGMRPAGIQSGRWVQSSTPSGPQLLLHKVARQDAASSEQPLDRTDVLTPRASMGAVVAGGKLIVIGGHRYGRQAGGVISEQDSSHAGPASRKTGIRRSQPRWYWGRRLVNKRSELTGIGKVYMGEVLSISLGPTHIPVPGPSLVRDASALWEAAGSGEVDAGNTPADFALRSVEQGAAAPLPPIVQVALNGLALMLEQCQQQRVALRLTLLAKGVMQGTAQSRQVVAQALLCPVYGVWRESLLSDKPLAEHKLNAGGKWGTQRETDGSMRLVFQSAVSSGPPPTTALPGRKGAKAAVVGGEMLVFGGQRWGQVAGSFMASSDTPASAGGKRDIAAASQGGMRTLTMGEVLSISLGPTHIPVPGPSLVRDASALWEAAGSGEVDASNTPADFALRSVEQGAAAPLPPIVQ
ncbi:rngB, partial [Symbiodinium sp. KB8]